jgi:hypothetical protein
MGSQLLKKIEVMGEIQKRVDVEQKDSILTRNSALEILTKSAREGEFDNHRMAAITQASKMCGWDAAQRHEVGIQDISISEITESMIGVADIPLEEVLESCAE